MFAKPVLLAGRTDKGETVNPPPGCQNRFVCSYAETERNGLSGQVWSQIHCRVDVATGTSAPRHPTSQRVVRIAADLASVAPCGDTSANVRIGDVQEVAVTDTWRRDFEHSTIPEYPSAHFRIEVVAEGQRGRSRINCDHSIHHLVADPVLIGDESVIRRAIRGH